MASPEFSEFTYGYALTDSLLQSAFAGLAHAPVFPSLIAEGSAGGGYDLKIPANPVPFFLQFKIPAVVTRRSKLLPPRYSTPYYRMPLRTKRPDQHRLLLDLSITEPFVYYATPLFHELRVLDRLFSRKTVHQKTLFIPPSAIGSLDDKAHHVAYEETPGVVWCRSEPRKIDGWVLGDAFDKKFMEKARQLERRPARVVFDTLWDWMVINAVEPRLRFEQPEIYEKPKDDLNEQVRRTAYLSQVRLGVMFGFLDAEDIM